MARQFDQEKDESFDVVVSLTRDLRVPLPNTDEKVLRLLGAITDVIANDDVPQAFIEGKADIFYGYACFPRKDSFAELFSKASNREKHDMKKTYDTEF